MIVAAILGMVLFPQVQPRYPVPPGGPGREEEQVMRQMQLKMAQDQGDLAYLHRSDGRNGDVASSGEIDKALKSYQIALSRDQEDADSRWKYLRATYFKAEYTGLSDRKKAALYERAMPVSDEAITLEKLKAGRIAHKRPVEIEPEQIGKALKGDGTAGEVFFWSGVMWGQWALAHGKLAAAREGAAEKIRDDARIAIGIDPDLEEGGGYRVLGRLNTESPRIPFLTGWISRESAVENLRKAVAIAPGNFVNQFYLAEALYRFTTQRDEAVANLRRLLADTPHPDHLIEDLRIQSLARVDLGAWRIR